MSHRAVNWAYSLDIKPFGAKFVLVTLADEANNDGEVWRGQCGIAARCSMAERVVRAHLATLEDIGLISRVARFRQNGTRSSDLIRLNLDNRLVSPVGTGIGGGGKFRPHKTEQPAKNVTDNRLNQPGIHQRNHQTLHPREKDISEVVVRRVRRRRVRGMH